MGILFDVGCLQKYKYNNIPLIKNHGITYEIGIVGFCEKNFEVKNKPSKLMKTNCIKVMRLPLLGDSL